MSNTLEDLPKGIRHHKSGGFLVDFTRNGKRTTKVFHTLDAAKEGRIKLLAACKDEPVARLGWVILPFLVALQSRAYAACLSFMAGVIPPMPMLGRSLL